jgi:hypothetical protein
MEGITLQSVGQACRLHIDLPTALPSCGPKGIEAQVSLTLGRVKSWVVIVAGRPRLAHRQSASSCLLLGRH